MIRINKEMNWSEVVEKYHNRPIFCKVLEYEKELYNGVMIPQFVYVECIIENRMDYEIVDGMRFSTHTDFERLRVPIAVHPDIYNPYGDGANEVGGACM